MKQHRIFAVVVVAVLACAGCDSFGLLAPDSVGSPGVFELVDDKAVVLRLEAGAPAQRYFVPVVIAGNAFADEEAAVDVDVSASAPFRLLLAEHPEQTGANATYSFVEDGFAFTFDLIDFDGQRLSGMELGAAAADVDVDVALLLHLSVVGEDPDATATFGRLEPHAP